MSKRKLIAVVIAMAVCCGFASSSFAAFVAYNDAAGFSSGNVTSWNSAGDGTGGNLIHTNGGDTGVRLDMIASGSPIVGSSGKLFTGGDAAAIFNGILNADKGVQYGSSVGWYYDAQFTGLDPARTYEVVATANRDSSSGYWTRITRFSIMGADASTQASSVGSTIVSPTATDIITGSGNASLGYVAQWTGIDPGADGAFTVRSEANPGAPEGRKAYGTALLRLIEVGGAEVEPPPPPPPPPAVSGRVISINIADVGDRAKDILPGELAGAVPMLNWNNAPLSGGGMMVAGSMVDNTGAVAPSLTLEQKDGDERLAGVSESVSADGRMYESLAPHISADNNRTFSFGPDTKSMLTGLLAEFPDGYNLHLYVSTWTYIEGGANGDIVVDDSAANWNVNPGGHGPPRAGSVANLSYLLPTTLTWNGAFVLGDNYLTLMDVHEDTLLLQPYPNINTTGFNAIAIAGIQIEGLAPPPIPEPAGLGLMGLALLAMRRRRS